MEKQPEQVAQPEQTGAPEPAPTVEQEAPGRVEPVDVIYGIFARPDETLAALAANPRPWLGFLSYALVSFISSAQTVLQLRQTGVAAATGLGGVIFMTTVAGLVAWLVAAGVMNLTAEIFGHRGSALGLITVLGVAIIPAAIMVPLRVATRLLGLRSLAGLGGLAIGIWTLILQVKAIKHNYGVSPGRAFTIFIAPFALILVVIVGFVFGFGVLLLNSPLLRGLPRLPGLP